MTLEATHLRGNLWAVRPAGQLGTCGWSPQPWAVVYVRARSAEAAVRKVEQRS
jgi:hypothetical protein